MLYFYSHKICCLISRTAFGLINWADSMMHPPKCYKWQVKLLLGRHRCFDTPKRDRIRFEVSPSLGIPPTHHPCNPEGSPNPAAFFCGFGEGFWGRGQSLKWERLSPCAQSRSKDGAGGAAVQGTKYKKTNGAQNSGPSLPYTFDWLTPLTCTTG